jgi:hypothetical protein
MTESLHYNAHYNWEWVVSRALRGLGVAPQAAPSKTRELPSRKAALKAVLEEYSSREQPISNIPPTIKTVSDGIYSLFRCEIASESNGFICGTWASNKDLEFLDAKDSLFRCVKSRGVADVMPNTVLIPWNIASEEDLVKLLLEAGDDCSSLDINSEGADPLRKYFEGGNKYFLKAALGSGGFGIYSSILSPFDILEVIKGHNRKAISHEGFIENLINTYGDVPSWSLQRRVVPVSASINGVRRNTQIRSYCAFVDDKMYLYNTFEVRVPIWEVIDNVTVFGDSMKEVEVEYVGSGKAIPYNQGRNKKDTERFVLSEVEELTGSYESIRDTSRRLLDSLKEAILLRRKSHPSYSAFSDANKKINGFSEMSLLGIDLVVEKVSDGSFKSYVVEVNNNPAMAPEAKKMSANYRNHLVEFVESTISLGLGSKSDRYKEATEKFIKVWEY